MRTLAAAAILLIAPHLQAADAPFDAAAAFGARVGVADLALSPDGKSIAYVAPTTGQGSILYTLSLDPDAKSRRALALDGKPVRLAGCSWVSNDRLVCAVYGVVRDSETLLPFRRLMAVNADGSNVQMLSNSSNAHSRGYLLNGGNIVDLLPDEDGAILMSRDNLPDDHLGTHFAATKPGLGVDHIDTRTMKVHVVESPKESAVEYLSDGNGAIRVIGFRAARSPTGQDSGEFSYQYRLKDSQQWRKLSVYNDDADSGFHPLAVDAARNIVYGTKKKDGRVAIISITLDESLHEELVYASNNVDVTNLIHIGRRQRVVGVAYSTDVNKAVYFDPELEKLTVSLSKALPDHPGILIVDSSVDETKLLVHATRDNNPGSYFLYDRTSRRLRPLMDDREELDGVKLATVTPITYVATDGTKIPAYITYPPGKGNVKGLPAIVMPHGGPTARDDWGFDWLSQFYAARGYVVIQPNYRGSSGYGDTWLQNNAFHSWKAAIGDVLDAGRWMVSQGIADPNKLAIVGWSYGGYAALQSAVVDASVFKAVVAIAPVTDLEELKEESRGWTDFDRVAKELGDAGKEASPAQNADKIKVPVLLFHAKMDRNVRYNESRHMDKSLTAAGVKHEFVSFEDLDHYLEDSAARTQMLRKSDSFLHQSMNF